MYVATNAQYYKFFEFWALSKGISISHIVNSGRSLGDCRCACAARGECRSLTSPHPRTRSLPAPNSPLLRRVDWRTVSLCIRAALATGSPRDVLLIAADSAPFHSGAAFAATLKAMTTPTGAATASTTNVLLQPGDLPTPAARHGPVVGVSYVTDAAVPHVVAVEPSVGSSPTAAAAAAAAASSATMPLCFLLAAADVIALLDADLNKYEFTPAALGEECVVPVEVAVAYCAAHSKVTGSVLEHPFQVGAADGRPHALPGAAKAPSPYVHHVSPLFAAAHEPVHTCAYARVGLMGNPSDGVGGKTVSVTVDNFKAEAWITPAAGKGVTLTPHPIYDPLHFSTLGQLSTVAGREGYSGGIRLMAAALHRFYQHCAKRGVVLPDKGFAARYHTTVPRQVGLAGSSAIITAFLRAVLRFYGYDDEAKCASLGLSRDLLPNFVLAIEAEELGITAGLQDRVVQSYEGCVHMNFAPELLKTKGHGDYTRVPVAALPPLFLAYAADPSDSGRIHAPIKQRWLAGDAEVVEGMSRIASYADEAHALASSRPYASAGSVEDKEAVVAEWGRLMTANFDSRRKLFGEYRPAPHLMCCTAAADILCLFVLSFFCAGDPALGKDNLRMITIARECGASAKFPGSGGAILGVIDVAGMARAGKLPASVPAPGSSSGSSDAEAVAAARVTAATEVLRAAYHAEGYVFIRLAPHEAASA